jgi:hypothetical protein
MPFAFIDALKEDCRIHPLLQKEDALKMACQNAYSGEHLLIDNPSAYAYLEQEWGGVSFDGQKPLVTLIGGDVCRVDLAVWKAQGYPLASLWELFVRSAASFHPDQKTFDENVAAIERCLRQKELPFAEDEWAPFFAKYLASGGGAIHHSEIYANVYDPHYRVVSLSLLEETLTELALLND